MDGLVALLAVAGVAALASPLGGGLGLSLRANALTLSLVVGFAAGVLLGTFAFEMMPRALEDAGAGLAVAGFAGGFAFVYGLDLLVNRGRMAGPEGDPDGKVARFHRRRRPLGPKTTVLGLGTACEELIEGLSIGVGMAIDPGLGWIIALAVGIDNVSEGMSLAELARAEKTGHVARRVLGWSSLIGIALFASALAGWFALRGMSDLAMGALIAAGAGGMFYLTAAQLMPEAEAHHVQQSAAAAIATGFLAIFLLSGLT